MSSVTEETANREKAKAAISSIFWSVLLTGIKIWAGWSTNSLGILSEALHSALDFCAAAMTFYAVKVAARPADDDHQYGHEKAENLSALAETALLLLTSIWIVWEAWERLSGSGRGPELTWWAFAVVLISLLVDVNRAAMLRRVAKEHKSQALEADAMHFSTDIWSSAVVLLGLICVWLAQWIEPDCRFRVLLIKADAIAGIFVAGIVLFVAFGLSKRAIHSLLDGGSMEQKKQIQDAMQQEAPEYPVLSLRLRDVGSKSYVEMTIGTPPELHVDDAHMVTELVENIVLKVIPQADVFVHVEPLSVPVQLSADAVAHSIAVRHHVYIHGFSESTTETHEKILFMDVEMPPDESLQSAYSRVVEFENDLKDSLGVKRVITRIEPDKRAWSSQDKQGPLSNRDVITTVDRLSAHYEEVKEIQDIHIDDIGHAPTLTVYGLVPGSLNVHDSHNLAVKYEKELHAELPQLGRVSVILLPRTEEALA
jgi:cation diffusion facilitator family transporter